MNLTELKAYFQLQDRVTAFVCLELKGQPSTMDQETERLVWDLWKEIERLNMERTDDEI